jgi:tetratricopeptide (TPR) repeat protein
MRTYIRNGDWHDQYRLLTHDYPYSRGSYDIENNIGYELFQKGDIKGAEKYFRASIDHAPDWPIAITNLGVLYEKNGKPEQALKQYYHATTLGSYYVAYERYARLLIALKRYDEARIFLQRRALPKFPNNAHVNEMLLQMPPERS